MNVKKLIRNYFYSFSILLLIFTGILFQCSNSGMDSDYKIELEQDAVFISIGDTVKLIVKDATNNAIIWSSDNETVATVSNTGLIRGISEGNTIITAKANSGEAMCEVTVSGTSPALQLTALNQELTEDIIYSKNILLKAHYRVMQGFDIDSEGNIYYIQIGQYSSGEQGVTKAHELYIIKSAPNSSDISDYMTVQYFGHGSNITIEEANDGEVYVWLNSNASKNTETYEYEDSRSISRIKYETGKVISDGYGGDTYFLNQGVYNVHPAVDFENRHLCVSATKNGTRYFYVYDLDEAMGLPLTSFTFDVTYGGEGFDIPLQTVTKTVEGKDLSRLTPIGSFVILKGANKDEDINYYSLQGFDIVGNYIYYNEGDGNGNDVNNGYSNDYVTVLDVNGNIIRQRTAVNAIKDISILDNFKITDTGYMEGEGIHVVGNKIYIGFASRRNPDALGGDNYRRANILVYDCK